MADVAAVYTLTTPALTITFNDGSDDQYFIDEISGLGAPVLRTPQDLVPLGDGGLIHPFWKGPRRIGIDGRLLILNKSTMNDILTQRNIMETDLEDALESILRADGSLVYTPYGEAQRTFTVRYEVGLEFVHGDNYRTVKFTFGLVAGEPDWAGSS